MNLYMIEYYDTELDMRMDQRQEKCARDIVNEYSEMELYRILSDQHMEQKLQQNVTVQAVLKKIESEA